MYSERMTNLYSTVLDNITVDDIVEALKEQQILYSKKFGTYEYIDEDQLKSYANHIYDELRLSLDRVERNNLGVMRNLLTVLTVLDADAPTFRNALGYS